MASTLFPRTRLYCTNCGENVGTLRITNLIYSRKSGGCVSATHSTAPQYAERMEAVRAPRALLPAMLRISVRAEHAMRDLIASNAPLREGRHKARQNGPKHYSGDPTGAAAPLVCLSPLSFAVQRKMEPPEGVGKAARQVKTYSERYRHRRSRVK